MTQIIKSGAFLQQCWSVHPLCVTVKRMADDGSLILTCSSCKSAHRLVLAIVSSKESGAHDETQDPPGTSPEEGSNSLAHCIAQHRSAVTMRDMDVFQNLVLLRCADCRRHYEATVASFETHQR